MFEKKEDAEKVIKTFNNTNLNGLNGHLKVRVEWSYNNKYKRNNFNKDSNQNLISYYNKNELNCQNKYRRRFEFKIDSSHYEREIKIFKNEDEGKVKKIIVRKRLGERKILLKRDRSRDLIRDRDKERKNYESKEVHKYHSFHNKCKDHYKSDSRYKYSTEKSKDHILQYDFNKQADFDNEEYKRSIKLFIINLVKFFLKFVIIFRSHNYLFQNILNLLKKKKILMRLKIISVICVDYLGTMLETAL